MANEEQLAILRQGVEVWNKWRKRQPESVIDLTGVNLDASDLTGGYLAGVRLHQANLRRAILKMTIFNKAELTEANLQEADLWKANLRKAKIGRAILKGANLRESDVSEADLRMADLSGADFTRANLMRSYLADAMLVDANLQRAHLLNANLQHATLRHSKWFNVRIGGTIFGGTDLSQVMGLESAKHYGPSNISTDTFVHSKGKIPEIFLRGCGLSDWEIEMVKLYNPDLSNEERNKILYRVYDLQANQAIQISPLFISYSHEDLEFVNKVEKQLNKRGIRFWRDIHDLKAGRIETQIDQAINQNRTVLLILSEHSLSSDWVEHEVRTARELEKNMERDVLCPIALDDSWKSNRWPKRIMEQIKEYNILDFSEWEDDVKFEGMFRKLIDGLELFYKK